MIPEGEIVPYHVSELPPGPWLVLAPHADDETFGMGGTLLLAKARGIPVNLVIMTDGALGGSRDDLVAVRMQEARQAAEFLGISKLDFLGEPDRGLALSTTLVKRLGDLIAASGASMVFFPGLFEPHPDHRATALLAWQALAGISRPRRPRAASYEITVQSPVNALIDITSQMSAKLRACALYASQTGENDYLAIVEALNKTRTFTLKRSVAYAEAYYFYPEPAGENSLQEILREFTARLL